MTQPLTDRQKEVFDFLKSYTDEEGYPPTIRDICSEFGFSSTNAASRHLNALEKKGWIERNGSARAIKFCD